MLTVLLATRNGAKTLSGVLEAYRRLEPPRGGWKFVLIDNGSTDASRQIITSFEPHLPLTYLFEATPGKNAALNAGLALVSGDLVVFTDDDAFPRADWLVRLREAADSHPTFGFLGGVIAPRWETGPPEWILRWVPPSPTFTLTDTSLKEGPVDGYHVFGPNMAVRTEVFDAGHRFDPSIGPSGSPGYVMGSETEFVLRVMGQGVTAWHVSGALVEHFIRAAQLRPSWILGRAIRFGRGQYHFNARLPPGDRVAWGLHAPPERTPRAFGFPILLLYQLARKAGSVVLAALRFNRERLFRSLWAFSYVYGYTVESGAAKRRRRLLPGGGSTL